MSGKRYNHSDVKKFCQEKGFELLSPEYRRGKDLLKFRCGCGEDFETAWYTVLHKNKHTCDDCSRKRGSEAQKNRLGITTQSVQEFLKPLGLTLLSEYKRANIKLKVKCHCGEIFEDNWSKFQQGRKECTSCSRTKAGKAHYELTLEEQIKLFTDKGAKPFLTEAVSTTTDVKYVCSTEGCENIHYTQIHKIKLVNCNPNLRCPDCSLKYSRPRGENHPHWNPDISDEEREMRRERSSEDKQWYTKVFKKYNHTCVLTGRRGRGNLSAHHLWLYSECPELRLSLENGVCIRKEFHDRFHTQFGKTNNTPNQFLEFAKSFELSDSDMEKIEDIVSKANEAKECAHEKA